MAYDGLGRLTIVKTPKAETLGQAFSTKHAYDINTNGPSKVTTWTRGAGAINVAASYFDGWGRTIETQVAHPTNAGRRIVSVTEYDDRGLPFRSTPAAPAAGAPGSGLLNPNPKRVDQYSETRYDTLGRPVSVTQMSRGKLESRSTTEYTGASVVNRAPATAPVLTTLDIWNRATSVAELNSNGSATRHKAAYTYNGAGQIQSIKSTIKGTQKTWSYLYDLLGRRVRAIDPDTGRTDYLFRDNQAFGENYTEVSTNPGTAVAAKIRTEYDYRGRPVRSADTTASAPGTTLATWEYDTTGVANSRGRVTKQTSVTDLGTFTTTVGGYDANGNTTGLTRAVQPPAGQTAVSVNENYGWTNDILTSTSYSTVGGLPTTTVVNSYGDGGGLSRITANEPNDRSHAVADLIYYRNGALQRATSAQLAPVVDLFSTTPAAENRKLKRSYRWDRRTGRLERLSALGFGALDYAYDKAGSPKKVTATRGSAANRYTAAWCYGYDDLQRLHGVKTGTAESNGCATQLTDATTINHTVGAPQDLTFTYADDRLTGVNSKIGATSQTVTYNYDGTGPHQATTITGAGLTLANTAANKALPPLAKLDYDQAGRITKQTLYPADTASADRVTNYTYNRNGTLKTNDYPCQAGQSTKTTVTNAYDDTGIRVGRKLDNACTNTSSTVYYLGDTEVTLNTTSTTTATSARRTYTGPNGPLALQESGSPSVWTWLLGDQQNNVRFTKLQATGSDTRPNYLPYGDPVTAGQIKGERGYLNKTHDPNGDIRLDHRTYNASLNILTTPDPLLNLSQPQSLNPYAYSRNNPISLSDPSGLEPNVALNPCGCHAPGFDGDPYATQNSAAPSAPAVKDPPPAPPGPPTVCDSSGQRCGTVAGYGSGPQQPWFDLRGIVREVLLAGCSYAPVVGAPCDGYDLKRSIDEDGVLSTGTLIAAAGVVPGGDLLKLPKQGRRIGDAAKGADEALSAGKYLNDSWYKSTFPNRTQSVQYHLAKHGNGRTAVEYTRDAMDFFAQNQSLGKAVILRDGTAGIKIASKQPLPGGGVQKVGGYWTSEGRLVTYWD